jgi:LysR family transcriptional regulator of abg operon
METYYCYIGINIGINIGTNTGPGFMAELRFLEHFVTVYRCRSFRAAADELGVAQSTVTKSIQRLEAQLGTRLFNRTTRTVEPTDTARQLLAKAESALQAAAVFDEEARLLAGGELGAIRVGAIALAAETLIVNGLARLANSHPNLSVEVVVGGSDIYRDLAAGECDLVIGDEANFAISPHAPSLRMVPVHEEQLVFVHRAGHPAARSRDLTDLLDYPLAIPSRYFNENRLFETMAVPASAPEFPGYRLNSLSSCLTLAATSDVVTLAPQSFAERLVSAALRPAIEIARFDTGINIRMALVTVARNAPTPAVRAFQAAIS